MSQSFSLRLQEFLFYRKIFIESWKKIYFSFTVQQSESDVSSIWDLSPHLPTLVMFSLTSWQSSALSPHQLWVLFQKILTTNDTLHYHNIHNYEAFAFTFINLKATDKILNEKQGMIRGVNIVKACLKVPHSSNWELKFIQKS